VQQVEELPPVRSSSRPHKPGLSQRLPPLRLFCPPSRYVVYALESQTKRDLLESTPTPARPLVLATYNLLQAPVVQVAGLQAFLLRRSTRHLCARPHRPDLRAYFLLGRGGFFFSAEQASKIVMINDMAKLWGLPPFVTPEGTPPSFEEAQVRFMEVPPFLSYGPFVLT